MPPIAKMLLLIIREKKLNPWPVFPQSTLDVRTTVVWVWEATTGGRIIIALHISRPLYGDVSIGNPLQDGRRPPRRSQTLVTVRVHDVNDCAPEWVAEPYRGVVPLDAHVGDNATLVTALDRDLGDNGRLEYVFALFS